MGLYEPLHAAIKRLAVAVMIFVKIFIIAAACCLPAIAVTMAYSWAMADFMPPATTLKASLLAMAGLIIGAILMAASLFGAYKLYGEKMLQKWVGE